jgi:membrane fusion protein, adhesin transport system
MAKKKKRPLSTTQLDFVDDKSAALLLNTPHSARIMLWVMVLFFIVAIAWASVAKLDKVTVGTGKVIPSSQLQIVQNLEGGIVKEVLIKEGQHVEQNQKLLLIDDTLFRSDFRERTQNLAGSQADSIRLNALLNSVTVNKKNANSNWRKSVDVEDNILKFDANFENKHKRLVQRQKK